MYSYLSRNNIPTELSGPLLIDQNGIPRYWATIWSIFSSGASAPSTLEKKLRFIETLYIFVDDLNGPGSLDQLLASLDIEEIGQAVEAYFISIRNRPVTENSEKQWRTSLDFVKSILFWITKKEMQSKRFKKIQRLDILYTQLQVAKPRQSKNIRSLPANVVEALFELLNPDSANNPFKYLRTRWRVFVTFTILLNLGLRRGELLLLSVDSVKSSYDQKQQKRRYWINITENPYEELDRRCNKPAIKTDSSRRQIPVNEHTAGIIQTYTENFRGRADHSFLISSQLKLPLCNESLTKIFVQISESLPMAARNELYERSGKKSITPHDLRHTCAVVFLNQLLKLGDSMDEALAKMRFFFGWSLSSDMPVRYAKAVFEDRLSSVFSKIFEDQVAILRAIPSGIEL